MLAVVVAIFCVVIIYLYIHLKNSLKYWEKKGIKGPKPTLFFGNYLSIFRHQDSESSLAERLYNEYPNEKVVGLYQGFAPKLVIRDIEIIKHVLIKDFSSFTNRGFKVVDNRISKHLFSVDNPEWRILRQYLSPVFTSGKLKQMMPLMDGCVKAYMDHLNRILKTEKSWDIRTLNMKYTLKGITSIAFGLNVDTFADEETHFNKMAKEIFSPNFMSIFLSIMKGISPKLTDMMKNYDFLGEKIMDYFTELVSQIIKEREGKGSDRKDFIEFMIEMKEKGKLSKVYEDGLIELEVDEVLIATQAFVFYAAGFETSSSTMSFLFHELALHPEIQERCFAEIKEVMQKHNGVLTYEALNELHYTTMVFEETLRKYPILGVLHRQCVSDYTFPGTHLSIKKDTNLLIPVLGLQRDPKYFPEPDKFDPERFSRENRKNILDGTYLPFGDGPRNCIGMRFAEVQTILGVAHFLYNYRVEPCEKTTTKMRYLPQTIVLIPIDGLWMNIIKR